MSVSTAKKSNACTKRVITLRRDGDGARNRWRENLSAAFSQISGVSFRAHAQAREADTRLSKSRSKPSALAMTSQGVVKRWRFLVPYVPAGQNGEHPRGRDLYRLFAASVAIFP
jgi:hypothetical protein